MRPASTTATAGAIWKCPDQSNGAESDMLCAVGRHPNGTKTSFFPKLVFVLFCVIGKYHMQRNLSGRKRRNQRRRSAVFRGSRGKTIPAEKAKQRGEMPLIYSRTICEHNGKTDYVKRMKTAEFEQLNNVVKLTMQKGYDFGIQNHRVSLKQGYPFIIRRNNRSRFHSKSNQPVPTMSQRLFGTSSLSSVKGSCKICGLNTFKQSSML